MILQRLLLAVLTGVLFSFLITVNSYADTLVAPTVTVQQIGSCTKLISRNKTDNVKSVYREGNDLVVSVIASASCGGLKAESPRVVFKGKSADLSWVWINPDNGPITACLCAHTLEFKVTGASNDITTASAEARYN